MLKGGAPTISNQYYDILQYRNAARGCEGPEGKMMGTYKKGDSVKIEVKNEATKESEWMWLLVDSSDDSQRIVFGTLDDRTCLLSARGYLIERFAAPSAVHVIAKLVVTWRPVQLPISQNCKGLIGLPCAVTSKRDATAGMKSFLFASSFRVLSRSNVSKP